MGPFAPEGSERRKLRRREKKKLREFREIEEKIERNARFRLVSFAALLPRFGEFIANRHPKQRFSHELQSPLDKFDKQKRIEDEIDAPENRNRSIAVNREQAAENGENGQ